ncbi:MAG TPA: hypothetical protein VHY91_23435 [Pirellulales bacterium]|jgi:probable HAF family extracellular repeat protein|nr:hypothetical protein [Pirellulales bacterium]
MKNSVTLTNIVLIVAAVAALGTSPSVQATEYSVTYLGNLSSQWEESYGWAINASGQVIGSSQVSGPDEEGFVWNSGSGIQGLGSLGGSRSDAYGINSSGTIVGASFIPDRSSEEAFVWDPVNGIQSLGWGPFSGATGINDSGEIVGYGFGGSHSADSVVNGTVIGTGEASAVNNVGQVVGVTAFDSTAQAYIWDPVNHFHDLGVLPGATISIANAINDLGQVVGSSGSDAFIWDSVHGMQDIGPGNATGINDLGQVTGFLPNGDSFIWDSVHGMIDLNTLVSPSSGWTIEGFSLSSNGINDSGQIITTGYSDTFQIGALLLTPVPEPSSFVLVATAFAGLAVWGRRPRRR